MLGAPAPGDSFLARKSVLVTGGTGSFGKAFIAQALAELDPERLIIYSRDELKQYEVRAMFDNDPRLRFFIGDVRDSDRLRRAMDGVDAVIHAAALKQVDTAEYNPFECIQTNVIGAQNIINAAIDVGVPRVVALSTDKASSPVNLYGASKLCSDKLFIAGNHYAAHGSTRFSVVRYGNVVGSRGSVLLLFKNLASQGWLPITDKRMTRFWITLEQAIHLVMNIFDHMQGGELYVPKIPSIKILDLAAAVAPEAELKEVGIRPGEKLHEEMISVDDGRRSAEFPDHYVVYPVLSDWRTSDFPADGKPLPDGFAYASSTNDQWLTVEQIREIANGIS